MSISSEIEMLKANITNAYASVSAKGGTLPTNKNTQNLSSAIDSITTGGGAPVVEAEKKDINFYDYDGTRLYSWTLAELATKTELPALPTQAGLICQGWNWTLAELKEQNTKMNVGALYITDDGKTRIHINLVEWFLTPTLGFGQTKSQGVLIDWGDGSEIERTNTTVSSSVASVRSVNMVHTYAKPGNYIITLTPDNDCQIYLSGQSSTGSRIVYGQFSIGNRPDNYNSGVKKIYIGSNVLEANGYSFYNLVNLNTLVLPFNFVYSKYIRISGNMRCLILSTFPSVDGINANFLAESSVEILCLPKITNKIPGYCFSQVRNLRDITLSNGFTAIEGYALNGLLSLGIFRFPKTINTIANYAFNSTCIKYFLFDSFENVPTMSGTSALNTFYSNYQIVVPDTLYDDWIVATNWATIASHIVKASEWEGQ